MYGFLPENVAKVLVRSRHGIVCDCYAEERWVGCVRGVGWGFKVRCGLLSESLVTLKMLLRLQSIAKLT